jgi:hypothetical protein
MPEYVVSPIAEQDIESVLILTSRGRQNDGWRVVRAWATRHLLKLGFAATRQRDARGLVAVELLEIGERVRLEAEKLEA